jgi:hypothetical protein
MKISLQVLLFSIVWLGDFAVSIRLGLKGRQKNPKHRNLRRGNLSGNSTLSDAADISYSTNIILGGAQVSVQIDTGRWAKLLIPVESILMSCVSADLWVDVSIPTNGKDTGYVSSIQYDIGGVKGVDGTQLSFI